jgi:cell division protein FtsI/penicillin-binding protein 2
MGNGRPDPRRPFVIAHIVGLLGLGLWFILTGGTTSAIADEGVDHDATSERVPRASREVAAPVLEVLEVPEIPPIPAEVDLRKAQLEGGRYVQRLEDGARITLTVDPATQRAAERALNRYPIQFGSVVALEPSTGRLLAMAEVVNDRAAAGKGRPATQAHHPAASIFKLVTSTALLQHTRVRPSTRVCVHGGRSGLTSQQIRGDRRRDKRCRRFSEALGYSDNAVFARLAYHNLTPEILGATAVKMGFSSPLDLPWAAEASTLELPERDDEEAFARIAAGFWHSTLSPVHAATLVAGIANDGVMLRPIQVDTWIGPGGDEMPIIASRSLGRVMRKRTAHVLTRMMVETTVRGTGRKTFGNRRDWPWRDVVEVASKTGSLSRKDPIFTHYSWFVAFAPADDPKIAVAVLVGNPRKWYVKAIHVARETLAAFFSGERERRAIASAD